MATRDLKGLTIEIGGDTSNLTDSLREVDSELSNLQSNLRTVNSALKLDPGNVDALAQRQALLSEAVATTAQRLEALREAQRQVDQQIADGVDVDMRAYRNLQSEIVRAEASLNDYQRQANATGDASRNAGDSARDAGDDAEDSAEGWSVLKGTIADLASNAIQNAISSLVNLGSTLWNMGDETRELRTNMGKLETAFQTSGFSAEDAQEAFNDFYAIVADEGQATEAASHLAKLTDSQKELEEWTTIATGVYATFGDSLPIENLTEAANETAKTAQLTGGLADALNWAGVNEEEFQAKLEECNSEAEREALIRETLTGLYSEAAEGYRETNGQIMEANRAQAEYNDALAGLGEIIEPVKTVFMQSMANMLRSVTEFLSGLDMDALKAKIQGAFDYITNTVFPAVKNGIQWFIDNKDTVVTALAAIVAGIAAFKVVSIVQTAVSAFKAFQTATTGLTVAQKALNLVMSANPIGLVVTAIAALVAAFITAYQTSETFRNTVNNAVKAVWSVVQPIAESIKNAFVQAWELIKVAWSYCEPFFAALWNGIKAGVELVKNQLVNVFRTAWEIIKSVWAVASSFFQNVWNTIANIFSVVKSVLSGDFKGAWEAIKSIVSGWAGYFQTVWNSIKNIFSAVGTFFKNTFSNAWNAVKSVFSGWGQYFSNLWNSIVEGFKALPGKIKSIGSDIVRGLWNGINDMVSWIGGKIKGFGDSVLGGLKKFFGIASPSKVMRDEVGRYLAEGIGEGISDNEDAVLNPMDTLKKDLTAFDGFDVNKSINVRGGAQSDLQRLAAQMNDLHALVSEFLPGIAKNATKSIYLDKRRLVGELASDMDAALGEIAKRKAVGAV